MKFNTLFIKKLVVLLLILQGQFLYSAELKEAEEKIGTLDATENVENRPEFLTLISSEGQAYDVPFEVVMQSNLIKTTWQHDQEEIEIPTLIDNEHLKDLIAALKTVYNNRIAPNKKTIYKAIQGDLQLKKLRKPLSEEDIKNLKTWLRLALYLDNNDLQNAIADKIGKSINYDNLSKFTEIINPEHWFLIEKYYYLRSAELRVTSKNMLFVKDDKLVGELGFKYTKAPEEFVVENIGKKIIYQMNLSIQDLLDYGKVPEISEEYGLKTLNLSSFELRSLKGLKNIQDLNSLQRLYLNNNQLKHLEDNVFSGLNSLQVLYLNNNQLTDLEDNVFSGLNSLQRLDLSNNKLTHLEGNVFSGLNSLQVLYLSKNQLTHLEGNLFIGLNSLQRLYLSNNKLTHLEGNVFSALNSLQWLYLANNPLDEVTKQMLMQFDQNHPNAQAWY